MEGGVYARPLPIRVTRNIGGHYETAAKADGTSDPIGSPAPKARNLPKNLAIEIIAGKPHRYNEEIIVEWRRYWTEYPKQFLDTEFAKQIKYTIGGKPVPDSAIEDSASAIQLKLHLDLNDNLLDLCCGNGLITKILAEKCNHVIGIDFSATLIDIANTFHSGDNVEYLPINAGEIERFPEITKHRFTKILMNAGLQYFRASELPHLIATIGSVLAESGVILLTAIPDRSRKSFFYNTARRKIRHLREIILRQDQMGTWWSRNEIDSTCAKHGFDCQFMDSAGQVGAPYRFDVRITRRSDGKSVRNATAG
jgi:cyclopropane fatty-acyl-phospholipid synthase-like methyltransferase